jgi:hypothetical protein
MAATTTPKPLTPEQKARAAKGRAAARGTANGKQHKDKPYVYGKTNRTFDLMRRYRWAVIGLREGQRPQLLSRVESVNWSDDAAVMTGSVTVRDGSFGLGTSMKLREGDRVRLFMDTGSGFRQLWTMRIYAPSKAMKEGQGTYKLANDLDLLRRSSDDFSFPVNRAHPRGWTGSEMIAEICRQYGVRIGGIAKFKFRRKKSTNYYTPRHPNVLGIIEEIINVEFQHTGKHHVIRWDRDSLWVAPFVHSPSLLALGPQLIDASYTSEIPYADPPAAESFASKISIRSTKDVPAGQDKKGRKR